MGYTNSPLVDYVRISPNKTINRNHVIDTVTIHCVVGQVTVERLGEIFASTSRQASSNYGIGLDGRIGMYVEEKDRSWCSGGKDKNKNIIRVNGISGADNDHRAVTIEVASDTTSPYAITDKAYAALINLLVDICKRNGIKQLLWKADKSLVGQVNKQNMTVHRWFALKACPGDYLYNRHGQIADEVNKRLGVASSQNSSSTSTSSNTNTYTVVKGDTLSGIGTKLNISWKTIADLNGIKSPYTISVGQVLKLPTSANTSNTTSSNTTQATPSISSSYTKTQFIKDVQAAIGAKVDGVAGSETLSKTPTISKLKNNKHAVVKPIQKYLYALGYTQVGEADCNAGAKFDVAVKAYQKDHGFTVDGEITAKQNTWKSLLGIM